MNDLISRRSAIDALKAVQVKDDGTYNWRKQRNIDLEFAAELLETIPSAEPEKVCIANITLSEEQIREAVEKAKNEIVQVLPSATERRGEWIPCSERLPEDDTLMLVNYIDSRPDAMDIWIGWHEMENVWYIDGEEHSRGRGNEVIAWMPLPEPWKGEPNECCKRTRCRLYPLRKNG